MRLELRVVVLKRLPDDCILFELAFKVILEDCKFYFEPLNHHQDLVLVIEWDICAGDLFQYLECSLLTVEVYNVVACGRLRLHCDHTYNRLNELWKKLRLHSTSPVTNQNLKESKKGTKKHLTGENAVWTCELCFWCDFINLHLFVGRHTFSSFKFNFRYNLSIVRGGCYHDFFIDRSFLVLCSFIGL